MVERGAPEIAQARSDVANVGPPGGGRQSGSQPAPPAGSGFPETRRNRGFSISRVLKQLWIPLVILAVVVAGGFTVSRLHGIFGSEKRTSYADTRVDDTKPFNPKHLRYEVFGAPGTVAEISYFDVNGEPQHIVGTPLPWSLEFAITAATAIGNLVAQGDSDSIGCRIVVDGVVKAQKTSNETNAFTYCMLKSA